MVISGLIALASAANWNPAPRNRAGSIQGTLGAGLCAGGGDICSQFQLDVCQTGSIILLKQQPHGSPHRHEVFYFIVQQQAGELLPLTAQSTITSSKGFHLPAVMPSARTSIGVMVERSLKFEKWLTILLFSWKSPLSSFSFRYIFHCICNEVSRRFFRNTGIGSAMKT